MDQTSSSAISTNTLHCALELSRNSWLLAIQFPDREQPSLYPHALLVCVFALPGATSSEASVDQKSGC